MNDAPVLRTVDLEVNYGVRRALAGVSTTVRSGEFVALAGPNGSGKTTLLRAALGLVPSSGGSVELFGDRVATLSVRERARRVAWMPQAEVPRDDVPLLDYVLYGRYARLGRLEGEGASDRVAARAALDEVHLGDRAQDGILSLSGGERQRAVLARALVQSTPLLLLDEPTSHLDIGHQLDLLERVRGLVRGGRTTVVAALHDLNLAARFADRIVVLHRGRVVADGPPSRVLSPRLLQEVWGVASELRRDPRTGLPYLLPRTLPAALELPESTSRRRVHVVAGGGTAAELLRGLADTGCAVSVGALPLFDSDLEVAEELQILAAVEVPFSPISDATRAELRRLLGESECVVVAPFPVGSGNLANWEELARHPRPQEIVLIAHDPDRPWDFVDGRADAIRRALIAGGAVEVADATAAVRRAVGPATAIAP